MLSLFTYFEGNQLLKVNCFWVQLHRVIPQTSEGWTWGLRLLGCCSRPDLSCWVHLRIDVSVCYGSNPTRMTSHPLSVSEAKIRVRVIRLWWVKDDGQVLRLALTVKIYCVQRPVQKQWFNGSQFPSRESKRQRPEIVCCIECVRFWESYLPIPAKADSPVPIRPGWKPGWSLPEGRTWPNSAATVSIPCEVADPDKSPPPKNGLPLPVVCNPGSNR